MPYFLLFFIFFVAKLLQLKNFLSPNFYPFCCKIVTIKSLLIDYYFKLSSLETSVDEGIEEHSSSVQSLYF